VLGCGGARDGAELTVYAAVDRAIAEPVLAAFEAETGIAVRAVFDSEALKTAGLAQRLLLEREHPRADAWWSGESLFTSRLAREGCFEAHAGAPWRPFASRVRVLVWRTDLWPLPDPPRSIEALADPRLKDRCILARATAGTTATHAAFLRSTGRGRALWDAIRANGAMEVAGNAHVVAAVRNGDALLGLTDSDDAVIARAEDPRLAFAAAEHPEHGGCALFLDSSAAVVRGAKQAAAARAFVDFVSGPRGEALLAASAARHLPRSPQVAPPDELRALAGVCRVEVDLAALAAELDR
jgi:iron(III) transport system substrate-binding protein